MTQATRFTLTVVALAIVLPHHLPGQRADPLPTLTLEPAFTIPGEGDGYYLSSVVDVLPAPDGTIVVREGTPEIGLKRFGPDGRFLGRIGREGEGPGEYLRIDGMGFLGDTLWTVDRRLRRVTWWSDAGARVRTWGDSSLVTEPHALLDDGTMVTLLAIDPSRRFRPLVRERSGETVEELPTLRTVPMSLRIPMDDGRMVLANPYAATTLTARAPDGSGVAWVQRLRPGADTTSSYRVVLWRRGRLTDRTLEYRPTPLTDRERAWHERLVDAVATQASEHRAMSALELRRVLDDEIRVPDSALPVYEALLDDEGRVWLAVESTPDAMSWVRLGPDLMPEARLTVSAGEEVMAIAYGKVFTRWKDEWDVPEVRVYRVVEGPGR